MTVYAFDVDLTIDCAGGPVLVEELRALREAGHIVGVCGNWPVFAAVVPDWQNLVSFIGPVGVSKAHMLTMLQTFLRADDYVIVGNEPQDSDAAKAAGWRFIAEHDFARGER